MPYAALHRPATVVGAVLEARGFHPARTARRHLLACTAAIRVPDAAAERALQTVGLAGVADHPVGRYSLGMRQRLAVAVALLGDPRALVLDEPGNGLDPEGIAWLRGFLREFARQGRSVLVSSHLLAEMEQTADRLVVINRGRRVYQGGLDELRSSAGPRVLVRCAAPARLAEALARTGLTEIDSLPDGRLAVAGADPVRVGDTALGRRRRRVRDGAGAGRSRAAVLPAHRRAAARRRRPGRRGGPDAAVGAAGDRGAARRAAQDVLHPAVVGAGHPGAGAVGALQPVRRAVRRGPSTTGRAGQHLVPLLSLAYTMVLTSVFAAVAGVVGTAGEFRHHTADTTYLLTPARGRVLLAKLALGGLVGALYAVAAAAVGVPAGHARHRPPGRTGR